MNTATRRLIASLLLLLATGCATRPSTPHEEAIRWISDAPRSIAIRVDRQLPDPAVVTYDHKTGARIGMGVGGALGGAGIGAVYVIGLGCTGGPIGCGVGLFMTPVAAVIGGVAGGVAGATSVKSQVRAHVAEDAHGSPALFAVSSKAMDLPALLAKAVISRGSGASGHVLQARPADEAQPSGETALQLRFTTLRLEGDVGEDAEVALVTAVSANLQTPAATAFWGEYRYDGSRRRVSEWKANDAKLFREEILAALDQISMQIVADLHSPQRK
jgi:hypothetical protein